MNSILILFLFCEVVAVMCNLRMNNDKEELEKQCGVEASPNSIHKNPWLVFLEYYRRGHITEIRCGGTLIDSRHILTAAHCVTSAKFSKLMARLGEYNTETKEDCVDGVCADPIQRIPVKEIIVHPEYDGKEHDIAVLKLSSDAPYTDFIRPVCLPSEGFEDKSLLLAAGWGELPTKGIYSDIKKIIPLPHVPTVTCKKDYVSKLPEHIICAGGDEGVDTCRGDSGGPLTLKRDRVELWGVTSLGNNRCGETGKPGIYTSVTDYMDWISDILNK